MSYLLWLKLYLHVGFKKSAEFAEICRNSMVTDFLKIGTVLIKTGIFYLKFNKKIRISQVRFFSMRQIFKHCFHVFKQRKWKLGKVDRKKRP
jgi:hypothetical protein